MRRRGGLPGSTRRACGSGWSRGRVGSGRVCPCGSWRRTAWDQPACGGCVGSAWWTWLTLPAWSLAGPVNRPLLTCGNPAVVLIVVFRKCALERGKVVADLVVDGLAELAEPLDFRVGDVGWHRVPVDAAGDGVAAALVGAQVCLSGAEGGGVFGGQDAQVEFAEGLFDPVGERVGVGLPWDVEAQPGCFDGVQEAGDVALGGVGELLFDGPLAKHGRGGQPAGELVCGGDAAPGGQRCLLIQGLAGGPHSQGGGGVLYPSSPEWVREWVDW